MVSALKLSSVHRIPTALQLTLVCCVYVELYWQECAAPDPRPLLVNWASIAIGLTSICCIPIAIGFPFVCHIFTAISVSPVYCEVGTRLLFLAYKCEAPFMLDRLILQ